MQYESNVPRWRQQIHFPSYVLGKRRIPRLLFDPDMYEHLGIDSGLVGYLDCGDFLKSCLESICDNAETHLGTTKWTELCGVDLSWKFECQRCSRYVVKRSKSHVITFEGHNNATFDIQLKNFLHVIKCAVGSNCTQAFMYQQPWMTIRNVCLACLWLLELRFLIDFYLAR